MAFSGSLSDYECSRSNEFHPDIVELVYDLRDRGLTVDIDNIYQVAVAERKSGFCSLENLASSN